MISRDLALRLVWIAFAYACAVGVATVVTVAVQVGRVTLVSGEAWVSPQGFWGDIVTILLVGFMVTFVMALPGFLGTVWLAWLRRQWRTWPFFAIMGTLDVFPAIAFYEMLSRPDFAEPGVMLFSEFTLICLPGGFLGGLAFWYVAFRLRPKPPISPAPSGS